MTDTRAPARYALRRLSPFLGTAQIIEVTDARAVSYDGRVWQIQLLSPHAVAQQQWGNIGQAASARRLFVFGVWSREDGVRRVPVNPLLGDVSRHPALPAILAAVESNETLPFALADRFELWLLDGERRPLALLASAREERLLAMPRSLRWQAAPRTERSFRVAVLEELGVRGPRAHLDWLERQVADRAGERAYATWFRREEDGSGRPLTVPGAFVPAVNVLPAEDFPALPLQEGWPEEPEQSVFSAYIDWLAPMLLCLPALDDRRRAALERAAVCRPLVLYQYRHLLPAVADHAVIDPALVEARMRQAL